MGGDEAMKYYRLNGDVWAFEADGSQDELITDEFIAMTADEIDRHINPQKYLTQEEKALLKRQLLPVLTKRQFNLYMYDHNLTEQINALFVSYPRGKIEFDSVDRIERNSPTVQAMILELNWVDEQVDSMWEQALRL